MYHLTLLLFNWREIKGFVKEQGVCFCVIVQVLFSSCVIFNTHNLFGGFVLTTSFLYHAFPAAPIHGGVRFLPALNFHSSVLSACLNK